MKLWLVHSETVTLREQIVRQVTLGALSGELAPGERLPSVREVARRHKVHPNTVSGAYHQLSIEGVVEVRRGSGIYIRARVPFGNQPGDAARSLDGLLARVARTAFEEGLSGAVIHRRLDRALDRRGRLLIIEPDVDLARLALYECVSADCDRFSVSNLPLEMWRSQLKETVDGFTPAVLPSKFAAAQEALGTGTPLFVFQISPVAAALAQNLPVSRDHLVGIASAWPQFLEIAQTLLIATGFSPDALIVRDARVADWERGLAEAAVVICDTLTAKRLPMGATALVSPLIADQTFVELRRMAKE